MTLSDYTEVNTKISSEMFFSIMRVLHNTLPCTSNFFRLKSKFVLEHTNSIEDRPNIKAIASPTMVRGLAFFKEDLTSSVTPKV